MVEEPFKLLIMDSITANLRVDFCGRGELAERQQRLGQLMSCLKKIAEEFNVAVLITNQACPAALLCRDDRLFLAVVILVFVGQDLRNGFCRMAAKTSCVL